VPLSKIQTDILRLLAAHRDPESYVAGSTRVADILRYPEDRAAQAALDDAATIEAGGYAVS
jgi:hypothetical protein